MLHPRHDDRHELPARAHGTAHALPDHGRASRTCRSSSASTGGRSTTCSGAKPTPYVRGATASASPSGSRRTARCACRSRRPSSSALVAELRAASADAEAASRVAINLLFSYLDAASTSSAGRRPPRALPEHRGLGARTKWRRSGASTSAATPSSSTPTSAADRRFAGELDERARGARARCARLPTQVQRRPDAADAAAARRSDPCSPAWPAG